jgi:hypothetical protein
LRGDTGGSGYSHKQIELKANQSMVDIMFFVAANKASIEQCLREFVGNDDTAIAKQYVETAL